MGGRPAEISWGMKWFSDVPSVYLHREPVDFRKAINGLVVIIESQMGLSPYSDALFIFCNRGRDKVKVIHWDRTGFVLWYKRLEQEKFKWPMKAKGDIVTISEQELRWLLIGLDILSMEGHKVLEYQAVS